MAIVVYTAKTSYFVIEKSKNLLVFVIEKYDNSIIPKEKRQVSL